MVKEQRLLKARIVETLERIESEEDADERQKLVRELDTLYKLKQADERQAEEAEQKAKELEAANEQKEKELEARSKELEAQQNAAWWDRVLKIGIAVVEVLVPVIFYGVWYHRGFQFEENGTYTSKTFNDVRHNNKLK